MTIFLVQRHIHREQEEMGEDGHGTPWYTQTPDSTFLLARVQYKVSNPLSLLSAVGSSNQPAGSPDVSLSPAASE